MTVRQMEWLLRKELYLLRAFQGVDMTDGDWESMVSRADAIVRESRGDAQVEKLTLDVLEAFETEWRQKQANRQGTKGE